jgi:hypothetical protein
MTSTATATPKWLVAGTALSAKLAEGGEETTGIKAETAFMLSGKLTSGAQIIVLCQKLSSTKAKISGSMRTLPKN